MVRVVASTTAEQVKNKPSSTRGKSIGNFLKAVVQAVTNTTGSSSVETVAALQRPKQSDARSRNCTADPRNFRANSLHGCTG
mmetsp:Transcript_93027/g.175114  ORF Transcript_93027/g.175114 Transcript_93027/m.175114 type:complete len:82 (-) Transcript_93027:459-704(-)